jgi:hypothetical protein
MDETVLLVTTKHFGDLTDPRIDRTNRRSISEFAPLNCSDSM